MLCEKLCAQLANVMMTGLAPSCKDDVDGHA